MQHSLFSFCCCPYQDGQQHRSERIHSSVSDHHLEIAELPPYLLPASLPIQPSGECSHFVTGVLAEPMLHSATYFFLGNLSCMDNRYSTVTVPKTLAGFLLGQKLLSFASCLSQLHFFQFPGSPEVILLTVVAYNFDMAICNALHYKIVMWNLLSLVSGNLHCNIPFLSLHSILPASDSVHTQPSSGGYSERCVFTFIYNTVTILLDPLIYTWRNQKIKFAIRINNRKQ